MAFGSRAAFIAVVVAYISTHTATAAYLRTPQHRAAPGVAVVPNYGNSSSGSSSSSNGNSAVRAVIGQNGFDEVSNAVNELLRRILEPGFEVPDIEAKAGDFKVKVKKIRAKDFQPPVLSVQGKEPNMLTAAASGLKCVIKADWSYEQKSFPYIKDHGSLTAKPKVGDVSIDASIVSEGGVPKVQVSVTRLEIDKFDIDFSSGGLSKWFLNALSDIFEGALKDTLVSEAKRAIEDALNKAANDALAGVSFQMDIGSDPWAMTLDYSLDEVQASADHFSIGLLGDVRKRDGGECGLPFDGMPEWQAGPMISLHAGRRILNCIFKIGYEVGGIERTISNADLPDDFPIHLNTYDWCASAPPLCEKFPDNTPMTVRAVPNFSPDFAISGETGLVGHAGFGFRVYVNANSEPGQTLDDEYVFTLGADVHFGLNVNVHQDDRVIRFTPDVTECRTNLTITESRIGEWDPSLLDLITSVVCRALPLVAQLLAAIGIPLPAAGGFSLVDPLVHFVENNLNVASSFALNLQ